VIVPYFFNIKKTPYLFDTKLSKLFKLENKKIIEINKPEILKNIRFDSIEIDRERVYKLVHRIE